MDLSHCHFNLLLFSRYAMAMGTRGVFQEAGSTNAESIPDF